MQLIFCNHYEVHEQESQEVKGTKKTEIFILSLTIPFVLLVTE